MERHCCRSGRGNGGPWKIARPPSGYCCTFTVALTKCGRSGLSGICSLRLWNDTQLSLPTMRSSWTHSISARSTPGHRDERAAFLFRRDREARVVRRYISVAQPGVGCGHRRDARQCQFLRHRSCKVWNKRSDRPRAWGEYAAICSTPRCASARPTWVGWSRSTLPPTSGCVKVMTSAIGIEAQRQTVPPEYLQQRPERRIRAFLLDQERRINPACRIVHCHDQIHAPAPRPATRAVKRPGAASCPATADEAASAGARRDARAFGSNPFVAGTPSSSCSPRRTGGPAPDARGNAAR